MGRASCGNHLWGLLMPTGFQVINENGFLQIDESFKNMVLVAKGTVTLTRPGGNGALPYQAAGYATISYPVSSRNPILAMRPTGSTYGACFLATDNAFTIYGAVNTVVEYFIFDDVRFGNAAGNVGMQVFDANGVELFNSNNTYMKVLGSYAVNLVVSSSANPAPVPQYSGSAPVGKKLAVAMGVQNTGYWVNYSATGQPGQAVINVRYWQCCVLTPSANSYILSNTVIQQFGGPSAPGTDQGAIASYNNGLILDVTNI